MIFYFLVVLTLLLSAIWLDTCRLAKKEDQWLQEVKEQTATHLQELDTAIDDWLAMLELPALEEQTKRQEVARRLRTVLIEKLLRQRVLS